ncbi:hypothetical protein C2845_PM09G23700 [Panicum miliaceum]|uniref:Uncharacterized protein n=1 Tax=Panicum miliaceum TaxID=4540 RepID=A0A3L6RXF7_PANMI|nr:hypothetical protein C2845_PM09G23700 [Panicum miliaceum]
MENSPPPAPAAAEEATQPDPLHPDPAAMPLAFPTLDSLAAFLRPRLPPQALSSWGAVPGTKTLLNLFLELSHGDCALHVPAGPPPRVVRAVHVATVRIRNRRGAARGWWRPGSCSPTARSGAAARGRCRRRCGPASPPRPRRRAPCGRSSAPAPASGSGARVEERESASYPGLPARYVLHAVDAEVVDGVPEDGAFETEEAGEDYGGAGAGAITVKRHYWEWVDDDGDGNEHKEVAAAAGAGAR